MKQHKSVFLTVLTIIAALAVCALPAKAQVRFAGATTVMSGGTNNVAAGATNTYSLRIDVPRSSDFALFVSAKPAFASTNSISLLFTLHPSIDGTTVVNTDPETYALAGTTNSSGVVSAVANITAGGIPYYFLTSVGNATINGATNITVSYGSKIDR